MRRAFTIHLEIICFCALSYVLLYGLCVKYRESILVILKSKHCEKRERMPMIENELIYDEKYCEYRLLYEGLEFCWDEKPSGDYLDTVKVLAQNYHKNIDKIAAFMLEDIREMYDESITIDDVKERIGVPKIEPELGTVTYCEQTFDYTHIFCFEFWDDEFEDLNYFAIDG